MLALLSIPFKKLQGIARTILDVSYKTLKYLFTTKCFLLLLVWLLPNLATLLCKKTVSLPKLYSFKRIGKNVKKTWQW